MGRRRGGFHRRLVDTRDIRQRFLIICEGETEKVYFEGFHAPHVVMRVKSGDSDPLRLVVQARDHQRRERDAFDQIWCVFDRDVVPVERFSRALQEAEESAIHIAYSNPAFELWFLLHFETCGALTRQDSIQRLGRWLVIAKSVVDDPALHWPAKFLGKPRTLVLESTNQLLHEIYG